MRRLKEMRGAWVEIDPAVAALVTIVEAMEPVRVSLDRKVEVLARVLEARRLPLSVLRVLLRPALVVLVLLLAGIATANSVAPRLRSSRRGAPSSQQDVLPAAAHPPASVQSVPALPTAPPSDPSPPEVRRRGSPQPARAGESESPARVVAAVRALRSEDDPVRAQSLALGYLRVYPHGALAEEALAVAIDASARRQDSQARRLAARYLHLYPNGRFRPLAQQALAASH